MTIVIVIFRLQRVQALSSARKAVSSIVKTIGLTSPSFVAGANVSLMQLETLTDLYIHELKDLYSAEQQLVKALPKMAKAARNKELAAGFQEHLEQTKGHAQRLEQILSSHKQTSRGPKCKGMEGIVAEGAELIEEEADEEVKDAGLISAAQRGSITKWRDTGRLAPMLTF
jgi:hypothetical protein